MAIGHLPIPHPNQEGAIETKLCDRTSRRKKWLNQDEEKSEIGHLPTHPVDETQS